MGKANEWTKPYCGLTYFGDDKVAWVTVCDRGSFAEVSKSTWGQSKYDSSKRAIHHSEEAIFFRAPATEDSIVRSNRIHNCGDEYLKMAKEYAEKII